jgi:hypothetical protein
MSVLVLLCTIASFFIYPWYKTHADYLFKYQTSATFVDENNCGLLRDYHEILPDIAHFRAEIKTPSKRMQQLFELVKSPKMVTDCTNHLKITDQSPIRQTLDDVYADLLVKAEYVGTMTIHTFKSSLENPQLAASVICALIGLFILNRLSSYYYSTPSPKQKEPQEECCSLPNCIHEHAK